MSELPREDGGISGIRGIISVVWHLLGLTEGHTNGTKNKTAAQCCNPVLPLL